MSSDDENRVPLSDGDYINASFIDVGALSSYMCVAGKQTNRGSIAQMGLVVMVAHGALARLWRTKSL